MSHKGGMDQDGINGDSMNREGLLVFLSSSQLVPAVLSSDLALQLFEVRDHMVRWHVCHNSPMTVRSAPSGVFVCKP